MSLIGTCSILDASASNIRIKYELQNTTSKTLYICYYYTLLENISNSGVVAVFNETKQCEVAYRGFKASRIPPNAKCYKKVEPNQTISNEVALSSAFSFQPNEKYRITDSARLHVIENLSDLKSVASVPYLTNPLTFTATKLK